MLVIIVVVVVEAGFDIGLSIMMCWFELCETGLRTGLVLNDS